MERIQTQCWGGHNSQDHPSILGRYGMGVRTDRGDDLATFAHLNNLTVANTMFQKRDECLWCHLLWSTRDFRQIDHILVSHRLRTTLHNLVLLDIFDKSGHRPSMLSLWKLQTFPRKTLPVKQKSVRGQWSATEINVESIIKYHDEL